MLDDYLTSGDRSEAQTVPFSSESSTWGMASTPSSIHHPHQRNTSNLPVIFDSTSTPIFHCQVPSIHHNFLVCDSFLMPWHIQLHHVFAWLHLEFPPNHVQPFPRSHWSHDVPCPSHRVWGEPASLFTGEFAWPHAAWPDEGPAPGWMRAAILLTPPRFLCYPQFQQTSCSIQPVYLYNINPGIHMYTIYIPRYSPIHILYVKSLGSMKWSMNSSPWTTKA